MEHEIGGEDPLPFAVDLRSADRLVQVIDRRADVRLLVPVGEHEAACSGVPPFAEHFARTIGERDDAAGVLAFAFPNPNEAEPRSVYRLGARHPREIRRNGRHR